MGLGTAPPLSEASAIGQVPPLLQPGGCSSESLPSPPHRRKPVSGLAPDPLVPLTSGGSHRGPGRGQCMEDALRLPHAFTQYFP